MAKLFAIDAQAREENLYHATRHALRGEQAPMVLTELQGDGRQLERLTNDKQNSRRATTI
jgi:hypothetical protein